MSRACITNAEREAVLAQLRGAVVAAQPAEPFTPDTNEPPAMADPLKPVPVYGMYLNRTLPTPDVFEYLAEKRLEMGDDIIPYLAKFDDFRIRSFRGSVLNRGLDKNMLQTGKEHEFEGKEQFVVVATRNKGVPGLEYEEVLGAFPLQRAEYPKVVMFFERLRQSANYAGTYELPISKSMFLNRVRFAYGSSETRMQKPALAKQKGNSYTLGQLKARYGKHYNKLFSKVYAITDSRGGRFPEDMVGKSVVFYAKFPKPGVTVDQLLREGVSSDNLGYIPLDESKGFSTIEQLLESLEDTATDNDYARGRLLLSDNILKKLFDSLYKDPNLRDEVYNSAFANTLNQVSEGTTSGRNYISSTGVNRALLLEQLHRIAANPEAHDAFNRAMQNQRDFPNGVYISPVVVKNENLIGEPVAEVYETEANEDLLYGHLSVNNLADHALLPGAFDFDLPADPQQLNQLLDQLLSPEATDMAFGRGESLGGVLPEGTIDISPKQVAKVSEHIEELSVSHIVSPFTEAYGINAMDLSEFVCSELSPMLMTDNSTNFTQRLQAYFDQNTNC